MSASGRARFDADPALARDGCLTRARRGFTLVELLIVISLIAVILGLGLGMLSRIDLGQRVAASLVENVIRSAHNWAVARQSPARVLIDVQSNTIRAQGMSVIGTWHFEKFPVEGAFGIDGVDFGGQIVAHGFQGQALSFVGEPARSRVEFPIEKNPAYDPREGFALQCAVRTQPARGGQLLHLGESAGIDTGEDGSLKGWITVESKDDSGRAIRGGRVPLVAPPLSIPAGRWTQIEFRYDRRKLRLFADQVLVAESEESAPVWRIESPLVISPGLQAWPGAIDNLVISVISSEEQSALPKHCAFVQPSAGEILFAAGGGLDREVHREPVRLALEFEDGQQVPIVINLYGTVE